MLVFDGDCSFCSSSVRLFKKLTKNRISVTAYQFADLESLGLTKEVCVQALQYVSHRGIFSGHEAVAHALIDSKTGWRVVGHLLNLPVIASLSFLVYSWVARNRYRLPGGTPECAVNR